MGSVVRMRCWTDLPDAILKPVGPHSQALLGRGCATYRSAAKHVRELPYGRNSDRAGYHLVLKEKRGTCSTKHALLAVVALEQGLEIALTLGIYDMSEANTPGVGDVLSAHGLESIPEAHCYLTFDGLRVDVTRAGPCPEAPISRLWREWSIDPSDIGEHKARLHRAFLSEWLRDHAEISLSADQLWAVREACIAALGDSS